LQQFLDKKVAKKFRQKPVSAKVAETLVETCFCQDGLTGAGGNLPNLILMETFCAQLFLSVQWHALHCSGAACSASVKLCLHFVLHPGPRWGSS